MAKRIAIAGCCASPLSFRLRRAHSELDCDAANYWNQGDILFSSSSQAASCAGIHECFTPANYVTRYWELPDLLLLPTETYIIELVEGYGVASCTAHPFSEGTYDLYGPSPASSMAWELVLCENSEALGCTQPQAMNYVATATMDDGSCLVSDCAGVVNGPHVHVEPCGCLDDSDGSAAVSCIGGQAPVLLESTATACPVLTDGREWTAPEDGHLVAVQVQADSTQALSISLSIADGPFQDSLMATAQHAALEGLNSCHIPEPDWITFYFDSLPIQGGRTYRIQSDAINLQGSCLSEPLVADPPAGEPAANIRLAFFSAPEGLSWGCRDVTSCNYDPAATHDSGECLEFDCLGQCPDVEDYEPAIFVEGCGCTGGPDSLRVLDAAQCTGCMDPSSCNYNPVAIIQIPGACNFPDCNGDCLDSDPTQSGLATLDPICGCIGGNTDPEVLETCNARCSGSLLLTSTPGVGTWGAILNADAYQRVLIDGDHFLTGLKLFHIGAPSNPATAPFIIELRTGQDDSWHDATFHGLFTAKTYAASDIPSTFPLFEIYFDVEETLALNDGDRVFIRLHSSEWQAPTTLYNSLPDGAAYASTSSSTLLNDMFIQVFACDDLLGCTDPTACNFESWATAQLEGSCEADCSDPAAENFNPQADPTCTNNDYCTYVLGCEDSEACNYLENAIQVHPHTFEEVTCIYPNTEECLYCPESANPATMSLGDLVLRDVDLDGICDAQEIPGCTDSEACNYHASATDPGTCLYPNDCSSCSGQTDGTGTLIYAEDRDMDGICDHLDDCSDPLAYNATVIPTEPCVFDCNSLPNPLTLHSVVPTTPAVSAHSATGAVQLEFSGGHGDPEHWITTWIGFTGSLDTTQGPFSAIQENLTPGLYAFGIQDAYGCAALSDTVHLNLPNWPVAPTLYTTIPTTSPATHVVGVPFTICD